MCFLWLLGILVYTTSVGNIRQVYGGKFVVGIGLGQISVIAPAYVAVSVPYHVRYIWRFRAAWLTFASKKCAHSQSRGKADH